MLTEAWIGLERRERVSASSSGGGARAVLGEGVDAGHLLIC